jgi:hypothetical protein
LEKFINLGFNNVVFADRVIAVVNSDAAPMRRMQEQARKDSRLIDATCGRKTRAVVITDSNHLILSSLQPETLIQRIVKNQTPKLRNAK